ncbi:MAG: hypothetical protein RL186_1306 [Pseudomonadota bacterium]
MWGSITSELTRNCKDRNQYVVQTSIACEFSSAAVAAAGVGAGVGQAVGNKIGVKPLAGDGSSRSLGNFTKNLVASGANAIANAATRSLIEGTDFGDNIRASLPDVVGGVAGAALAGAVSSSRSSPARSPNPDLPSETSGGVEPLTIRGQPLDIPSYAPLKFDELSLVLGTSSDGGMAYPGMTMDEVKKRIEAYNNVADDGRRMLFGYDSFSGLTIGAGGSASFGTANALTGEATGLLTISGLNDRANDPLQSLWYRFADQGTANRLFANSSGVAAYFGGDASFGSLGLRVQYGSNPAVNGAPKAAAQTLRQQQNDFIQIRNANSAEVGSYYFGSIAAGVAFELAGMAALAGVGKVASAAGSAGGLTFGRKLDFLFNKGIDQSNAYNAARAAGNAERIGIADTAANRAEVVRRFEAAYRDPSSIFGPGKVPGSNVREFFLPGVTGTGSKITFVEKQGKVITIIAK